MLTRLKVSGFKNLIDVDVWFGPFTCVAGANGVGKSNLFDAITFLRLLASEPLVEAATSIRDEAGRSGDVASLFTRTPDGLTDVMRFEAEMIVPKEAVDQRGRRAVASGTFLKYELELRYRGEDAEPGPLEVRFEQLSVLTKADASGHLPFDHSVTTWRDGWFVNRRRGQPFISTVPSAGGALVAVHQDQAPGRPELFAATTLQRTLLSEVTAAEAPTVVVARQEMRNWQLLHFEPTALRSADPVRAPRRVSASGGHMPSALFHLIRGNDAAGGPDVRATIANRVARLADQIRDVWVDEDLKRGLLTLHARFADDLDHPARSMSDGTLRFLALAIIEQTPQSGGLYCLEEPENGIPPDRLPALLKLLEDIATDPDESVDNAANPLRQVIINTHSPAVVAQVAETSLVVAERTPKRVNGLRTTGVRFSALAGTWRTQQTAGARDGSRLMPEISIGRLLRYINPIEPARQEELRRLELPESMRPAGTRRRVIDRDDARQYTRFEPALHD